MENIYFIIEMIVAALFAGLTLALSEKFLQAGIKTWGWLVGGFILLFIGAVTQIAFSVESFARLYVPSMKDYALFISHLLRICGLLMVLSTFYYSIITLYRQKMQEQARQDSFKLLDNIRDTVNQSLSLIELLNFSIREFVNGTNSEAGCVFIYNPNRDQLVLAAQRDLPRNLERRFDRLDESASLFYRTLKNSQPYLVGNIGNSDKDTSQLFSEVSFKSLLAVPLIGRSGSFGVVVIFSNKPFYYNREQTQLILSAANILGPTVATFRLERDLRDTTKKYKQLIKSEKFLQGLLEQLSSTEKTEAKLEKLARHAGQFLHINSIRVYSLDSAELACLYPAQAEDSATDELSEHIRRAIQRGKSLMVRTDSEGSIEKTLIIPAQSAGGMKRACVLSLAVDTPDLTPAEIEQIKILAGLIDLQFEVRTAPEKKDDSERDEALPEVEDLNNLNNIMTGILGNAQLLGVNLKKENLNNKQRAIHSLDTIIEETFEAGQLIRAMQDKIQRPKQTSPAKTTLESVLRSLVIADKESSHSRFFLKNKPRLGFDLLSSQNGTVDLSPEDVRSIILNLFGWLEYKWHPRNDLSVKLVQTEMGMHFVVSETLLGSVTIRVNDYKYSPLNILLGTQLSSNLPDNVPVTYYYNDDEDLGRFLVVRFPHGFKPESSQPIFREKSRILAIDDQQVIRELLSSMLEELKYPHQICENGLSGIEAFEEGDFDILITDLGLPDIDGWQVAKRVKELKPETPVIVITGWGLEALSNSNSENLADYILPKPFRMEQLGQLILEAEGVESSQT